MLKVMPYNHRTLCDTYGCNRFARHSIGMENEPGITYHNVCDKCLQAIADNLPIEMIKDRLKKPCKQCHLSQVKVDAQEELNDMPMRDLRDIAKREGIKGYSAMNKDEIIAELTRAIK